MELTYGQGTFQDKESRSKGIIVLSEHKLFIRDDQGDLSQTFIPLEKVEKLKKASSAILLYVRPSIMNRYVVKIVGVNSKINQLINEIVGRRGLKKRFLIKEWFEVPH